MPTTWNTGEWGVAEDEDEPERSNFRGVLIALAIGSLVAVAIGVYGKVHTPTNQAFSLAGFSTGLHAKTWLGTISFVLAVVQVISSLAMWGRLPGVHGDGRVAGILHRWSGRLAVLAQWRATPRLAMKVHRSAFTPPPKVMSAIIHVQPDEQPPGVSAAVLERLTAAAFGQRRKMLRQSLKSMPGAVEALERLGMDSQRRAETLSVAEFVALAREIGGRKA